MPVFLWRPNPSSPDEQSCKLFNTPCIVGHDNDDDENDDIEGDMSQC